MALKITILFDNYLNTEAKVRGLKAMWGFSAFVEFDHYKIIFDTGSNGRVLKHNAQLLGVELSQAQMLFISHPHWDHIGGWDTVLEENPEIHVIVPDNLSSHLIEDLKNMTRVTVVGHEPGHFDAKLHSTGVMQPEGEHSLILTTDRGLVIIAGCSHPGIENIIRRAKEIFPNKQVYYVIGGFHLFRHRADQISQILNELDTQFITQTHCTGQLATDMIRNRFGDRFIPGGVGAQIVLP
jgi:7,8-dihydropterin-6-yl-methyl-4-(beta-D-ribofuranosyl)aminobenzene 5'-phosphate synthase